jgi:hypothetical protein
MFDLVRRRKLRLIGSLFLSLAIAFCITLGLGMSFALGESVDPVPSRFQSGQELYLENCSGCHIAIAPEVLPTETWKQLLEKPEDHYGQSLKSLIRISQLLMWEYLQTFSRPLNPGEPVPLLIDQSRYFKALHPKVKFSEPVTHKTCIQCHPGVAQFNYQTLTPEWQDAP